jgi:membrane protein DedA with SNARE-associated domain/membrane-associated phospholipid phosphatase
MNDVINPILQWLNANPNWAGLIVFLISASESVAIIGTIVPGTIMMTAIGTLAGAGVIPLWSTIFFTIIGAIVGDGISYMLGHHFKDRIRQIWPFRTNPEWLATGERFFHKHGGKSVFIGRFVGPVRAIVPLIAGMLGMKPLRFYIANITSAIGWAPVYLFPGIILGAASLELPPDMAVHALLVLLLVTLFIIFCIWLVVKILMLIRNKIEQSLNVFWSHLQHSRYAHIITVALKHHNPLKTHGQLVLAFYFLCALIGFVILTCIVKTHGSQALMVNHVVLHFFRSLRSPATDNVMLVFTLLGEKRIIIPTLLILFGYLLFKKRYYLAWHVIALAVLAVGSAQVIKHLVHSLRPWGITGLPSYSFPSGHTLMAVTFFIGLALLMSEAYAKKRRYFVYIGLLIAAIVSISRLYLGAHWFTDVLASWLLGTAILIFICISYNRKKDPSTMLGIKNIILVTCISFSFFYGANYLFSFDKLKQTYKLLAYPSITITAEKWWQQSDLHIPIYRVNRFGLATQVMNLQWAGDLASIQQLLLEHKWEIPPERDWINILQRITDVQSAENLPLVSPIYLDKKPVLVLIKRTDSKNRVMVLRLWDSNISISPTIHLWVGTVSMIPRTYSWIFKKKTDEVQINPDILFQHVPSNYVIKEVSLSPALSRKKYKTPPTILLIKSKTLLTH